MSLQCYLLREGVLHAENDDTEKTTATKMDIQVIPINHWFIICLLETCTQ